MMPMTSMANDFVAEAYAQADKLPTINEELRPLAEAIARLDGLSDVRPEHVSEAVAYLIPERRAEICSPKMAQGSGRRLLIYSGPGSPTYERMRTVFQAAELPMAYCPWPGDDAPNGLTTIRPVTQH